jgi:hypothetical protein
VLAAAAAVLLLGVLLPFERSRVEEVAPDESAVDAPMDVSTGETTALASTGEMAALVQDESADVSTEDRAVPPASDPADDVPLPADDLPVNEAVDEPLPDEAAVVTSATPTRGTPAPDPPAPARPQRDAAVAQRDAAVEPRPTEPETRRAAATAGTVSPAPAPSRPAVPSLRPPVVPAISEPAAVVDGGASGRVAGTLARVEPPPAAPPSPPPAPSAGSPPAVTAAYVPPSRSVAQPAAPDAGPDGEAAVRDVLQRYVAAYNRLDAVAARAVWPGVNKDALERAFSQLDSQTLRFEQCDIALDEAAGTATCDGQARWVPRVGGRDPKRERRTWRFELARSGEDWVITRAEARR